MHKASPRGSAQSTLPVSFLPSLSVERRAAKLRRKALAKIQKSTARKLRLGRHEAAMADALLQVGAWLQLLGRQVAMARGRGGAVPASVRVTLCQSECGQACRW